MDDQSIVSLFWARTDRAIAETQVKYGPYCTRIARNILSDSGDSEETVSDTWLAAWNAIPPDRPVSLAPYLGRITRNLALNRLKARQADKRGGGALPLSLQELEECIPASSRLEEGVEARELGEKIGEFLRREPGEARKIFVLRYLLRIGVRHRKEPGLHAKQGQIRPGPDPGPAPPFSARGGTAV